MKNHLIRVLGIALLLGAVATIAFAGGPNYIFDPANKIPYVWKMEHWTGGAVPVYTDLGNLELLTNAQATDWAVRAWDQWNNVPSSTFRAHVVGNVSLLGLSDITTANVAQVYPAANPPGGVTVVFDTDGTIFTNYLGLRNVLGISFMEYAVPGTNEILEGTVFLNGRLMFFNDLDGAGFSGVFTHEFGHALNLRHSQGNGAVWNSQVRDTPFPFGCTNQPYPGTAASDQQVETMYPFLDQRPGHSAQYMFTVDKMDDISAISDLYPAPGWPESHGTVTGTIRELTKILGNGTGPAEEVTGVNIIARNLADPLNDFVSGVSGELTRGALGPDGSYVLHGLTPGATYGIYTDNLAAGAFPFQRLLTLPGPEEWYNGVNESGNGETDARCAWTGVSLAAGATATADITFNRVKGAPSLVWGPIAGNVADCNADGSVMTGTTEGLLSYWSWTADGEFALEGGRPELGGIPSLSDDGTRIAGVQLDANGVGHWAYKENGAWTLVPPPPAQPGFGPCIDNLGARWGSVWGLSGDGSTLVGQAYTRGCQTAGIRAATWSAANGWVILPKSPDSATRASRAQAVSYDGSVVGGFDTHSSGLNRGVYWIGGVEYFVGTANLNPVYQDVNDVTRDGTIAFGTRGGALEAAAYRYFITTQQRELLNDNTGTALISAAYRGSDAGDVVLGFDNSFEAGRTARIWTPQLGWMNQTAFLEAQGLYTQGTSYGNGTCMSGDGQVWGGYSSTPQGFWPWRIEIPKAIVCHKSPGNPNATAKNLDVTFPGGLAEHRAHGDTLGLCQTGSE
jgi:hypothetical protein